MLVNVERVISNAARKPIDAVFLELHFPLILIPHIVTGAGQQMPKNATAPYIPMGAPTSCSLSSLSALSLSTNCQ